MARKPKAAPAEKKEKPAKRGKSETSFDMSNIDQSQLAKYVAVRVGYERSLNDAKEEYKDLCDQLKTEIKADFAEHGIDYKLVERQAKIAIDEAKAREKAKEADRDLEVWDSIRKLDELMFSTTEDDDV